MNGRTLLAEFACGRGCWRNLHRHLHHGRDDRPHPYREDRIVPGSDRRHHGRHRQGGDRSEQGGAVLAWHDGRDQCTDHAAPAAHRDGLHQGFSRRDRDPPRQQGRLLGHLQGRREALCTASRPADRRGARRRAGRNRHAARRGGRPRGRPHPEAAQRRSGRGLLHERLCQWRQRAAHEADPGGGDAGRSGLDLLGRCCRKSSSTSASRPRSSTRP